jgi:hypothetical protein
VNSQLSYERYSTAPAAGEESPTLISTQDKTVQVSFEYASVNDLMPMTTIYNSLIMIPSLSDQVLRFGLHKTAQKSPIMTGHLKGGREEFLSMIYSYGFKVAIGPVQPLQG